MFESQPAPSPGTSVGYSIMGSLVLLDIAFLLLLLNEPISLLTFIWGATIFVSLPVIAFIAYWTSALATARYVVRDNVLTIKWGLATSAVALNDIKAILPGQESTIHHFRGVRWTGYLLGKGQLSGMPEEDSVVYFYATRPPAQQLLLQTPEATYALSPDDLESFRNELEALKGRATHIEQPEPLPEPRFLSAALWHNRTLQGILLSALVLNALLFAYVAGRYPTLPATIPLHFDSGGVVSRADPARLFLLPFFGLLAWFVNGALGWYFYQGRGEKPVGYMLWSTAAVLQIAAWVAVVHLLN